MYICLKCKEQFSDVMTSNGECPFCGTISMPAQQRKNLEFRILNSKTSSIKRLLNYIDRKNQEGDRLDEEPLLKSGKW